MEQEERFCILETKVSYHDKDLAELNETVFRQQQVIDRLQAQLKLVTDQLKGMGVELDPSRHQKPPHY
jgi:SlyX protein